MSSRLDGLDEFSGELVRLRGLRTEDGAAFLAMDRDIDGTRRWGETNLPRTDDRARAWLEEQVTKNRSDDTAFPRLSRRTSVTDGKGQLTTTSYDALDRPTKIAFADGRTVSFGYDAGGRLTSRTDAGGTTTYVYDRLNRLVEERVPSGATNVYAYDPVGNLTSMTDVGGTVSYRYNAVNLVDQLTEPGGAITTFGYDNDNNRTSTTYPNGVAQSATYDASNRVKTVVGTQGLTTLTSFAYDYNVAGKDTGLRRSVTDVAGNVATYDYDALDRLDRAVTKNSLGVTTADYDYGYDAVGNRTSEVVNGVTTTASFNAADQLTSRAGVTYSYDLNGNQTGSSAGQSLAYNGADQTTSLKRAGGTALSAAYAGPNQVERISAGAATFTNSVLGVSATTEAGATTATTRDPNGALIGLRTSAGRFYYLLDGLGSVVAVTDGSGNVTNSYTYDPYGATTESASSGAVANPWRYTGQYQDLSTGLYKMGARYYQPELGRWTQPDPSGQDANAYLYVGGNPVNFVDPSGLSFFSEFKDYLTAADADKASDDPTYNNRFSNAEATAGEAARDTGEFIGRNAFTAYKYGASCLAYALEFYKAAGTNPDGAPGFSQTGAAAADCAIGVGVEYLTNQP